MSKQSIDIELVQKLLVEIIKLEKQFIYDKTMSEAKKIQEIKQLIENEVALDAN